MEGIMSQEEIQQLLDTVQQSQKEWLTPDDLFTEFKITKSTQAKMRMDRKIPYSKIGKYVRYKRERINKMFDDAKVV